MDPMSAPSGEDTRQRILNQSQYQARARLRQQKLKVTFIGYIIVLMFFAFVQFIGIAFFTSGFLLKREVSPIVSDIAPIDASYDKAVVFVIDALRFDFTVPVQNSSKPYHNSLPILYDLAQTPQGALLKFVADPPTTTLQRLKGMTTGSLPTFIDAGSNFDGTAIDEDNWLLQLHRHNRTVAFMGDDTWDALFSQYIDPNLNFPYDSLNVWDLHTVDNGVIDHMFPLLDQPHQWDVLIGHCLGVDHVGHRYGPNHFTMKEKLSQMNQVIADIIDKLDDRTLLVVMGDHGMDETGNHGGDAPDEVESAIFFYSKKPLPFHKLDSSHYNISNAGADYRRVNQIDLVPTMSVLLGLPIPHNNLGFPIEEAFSSHAQWAEAAEACARQLDNFHRLTELKSAPLPAKYDANEAAAFQHRLLEECHRMWAEFDLVTMSLGILIIFLALTFILTYARSIPSVRVSTMSFEFIGSVVAMSLLGVVLSFSVYIVLKPADFTLKKCIGVGASLGTIIGFWAPIMDRFSVSWLLHQVKDFFVYNFNTWSFIGLMFVVLHTLVFASNSFVVWEDQMINFFVVTFGFALAFACATSDKLTPATRILGLSHAVTFTVLSRATAAIGICREEQRPYCVPSFATQWWSLVLLFVVAWLLPAVIMHFYKLSDSYHSAAPLWVGKGLKSVLVVNAVYWSVEWLQSYEPVAAWVPFVNGYLVKAIKLSVARLMLFSTLFMANLSWSKGPLCVKLANGGDRQTILGYNNVYGSSYFLLVLNFLAAVMLVSKPMAAVSLAMLVVQILSLLELFDMLDIRRNVVTPIVFTLLGYQHFFSTGHQATIPSIQWEVGFITTETIWFPFTHLNIVLNTFGSFIVVALAIPLITLWKIVPSNKPITVLSQVITNVTTMITYQIVVSLSSLLFAAHFRRHLMVWKIFAPRFMLSGMLIIVLNVVLVLVTLWFGTGKVVTQVNRIFGK
ncbi:GPI ethanolamine phosphate transferase 3 [Diutina rugosa]